MKNVFGTLFPFRVVIEADFAITILVGLIAVKAREDYNDVITYLRTRICFPLLKSILIAVRGVRGKGLKIGEANQNDISLNLIPVF